MGSKLDNRLDPVLKMFSAENWTRLNAEERLGVFQQMENIMAKMQGREPLQVGIISPNDPDYEKVWDCEGVHDKVNHTIRLNLKFFENRSTGISGVDQNNVWDAVNTLLHEGRHAWQTWLVRNVPEDADPVVLKRLLLNAASYHPHYRGTGIYLAQANEVDARRYAIEMLRQIGERMDSLGFSSSDCKAFQREINKAINDEILNYARIMATLKTENFEKLIETDVKKAAIFLENTACLEARGIHWDPETINRVKALMKDKALAANTLYDEFLSVSDKPKGVLLFAQEKPLPIKYPEEFTDYADTLAFKDSARLKSFLEKIDRTPGGNDAAADIRVSLDDIK